MTNPTYHFDSENVYDEARVGEPTTYAKNKGPSCDVSGEYCWYWLRSISNIHLNTMVDYDGRVSGVSGPECPNFGVRPAIYINLNP